MSARETALKEWHAAISCGAVWTESLGRWAERVIEAGNALADAVAGSRVEVVEALRFIAGQENLTFAECTVAEEIVGRAKAALRLIEGDVVATAEETK